MKFLFDLFPVLLFFLAFKFGDIFIATGVAMAATAVQILWVWFRKGKVDTMLWVSLGVIVVFGGLTLLLHDETFMKWKPTVLYWIFALALAVSVLFFRKNLIRALLGQQLELPERVWAQLNWSWVGFFTFMGFANLAVAFAFGFSTADWVNFKLFGLTGLLLLFVLAQGVFLSRHIREDS